MCLKDNSAGHKRLGSHLLLLSIFKCCSAVALLCYWNVYQLWFLFPLSRRLPSQEVLLLGYLAGCPPTSGTEQFY